MHQLRGSRSWGGRGRICVGASLTKAFDDISSYLFWTGQTVDRDTLRNYDELIQRSRGVVSTGTYHHHESRRYRSDLLIDSDNDERMLIYETHMMLENTRPPVFTAISTVHYPVWHTSSI